MTRAEHDRRAKLLCELLDVEIDQEFSFRQIMCFEYGPCGTNYRVTKEGLLQMWDCNRGHWCFASGNVLEDWINGTKHIVRWPVIREEDYP